MGGGWSTPHFGRFTPEKRPIVQKVRWAHVDECGKVSPAPGFDPRTVQPVGSRYTD